MFYTIKQRLKSRRNRKLREKLALVVRDARKADELYEFITHGTEHMSPRSYSGGQVYSSK